MVLDLVKQAILLKLVSKSESPIISPAEFCYASGYALHLIGSSEEIIQNTRAKNTIPEMMNAVFPQLESVQEQYKQDPANGRLLHLLLTCKVDGNVTDELRELFDMGLQG